jgi:hypothetical protein
VRNASEPAVDGRPPRSLAFACARGYASGLLLAIGLSAFDMMRYRIAFPAVSVVDYLMIWPALCLAGACLRWRGDGHVANASEQEQGRRPRWRKLYVELSVAIGLAYGLIATGLELLWRGWLVLPGAVVLNLILFPFLGLVVGLRLSRAAGEPRWSWRFMRFSMRTMLLLIAYLSLLGGLGVVAARIGVPAHRYFQQHLQASGIADVLSTQLPKSQAEVVVRFRNASQLRQGTIPTGIMKGQKDFLKSLDADEKVKPEYRMDRFGKIADGEEWLGRQAEVAVQSLTVNIDYYSKLAAKYEQAMREPWLPVEPDGPRP